jgi:hypothetical protein
MRLHGLLDLEISKFLLQCLGLDSFVIFLIFSRISYFVSGFMVISLVFLDFYFFFLVEICFLAYLRFYKPLKEKT